MRYVRVMIKRDTQTTYNRECPEWEIPILEFIFEDGNVTKTKEYVVVEGEYPDAGAEFGRLASAYGADAKSGVPHVASVYGEGGRGVRELARAIAESKGAEAAAKKPAAKSRKAVQADPLMA